MTDRDDLIARIERAEEELRESAVRHGAMDFFSIDLTMQQLRALLILAASGAMSAHGLAESLGIGPTTLTGIVDRLQARGLVHRLPDGRDRRIRRIDLTRSGRRLLHNLNEVKREHQRRLLGRLEVGVLEGLAEAVEALASVCADLAREDAARAMVDDGPGARTGIP